MQNPRMPPDTVDSAAHVPRGCHEVAIHGAGIVGAMTALALLRDGRRVPLASERGYHVVWPDAPVHLPRSVMPSDGKMAMTPTRAGLRVAGQVELASVDAPPDWRRALLLADRPPAIDPRPYRASRF